MKHFLHFFHWPQWSTWQLSEGGAYKRRECIKCHRYEERRAPITRNEGLKGYYVENINSPFGD